MVKVLTLGAAGALGSEIVRWLETLPDVKQTYPDYIEAADTIATSDFPYTLIRTADLTEDGDSSYHLQKEGQGVNSRLVSRAAVARLISEIIASPTLYRNESIGITN